MRCVSATASQSSRTFSCDPTPRTTRDVGLGGRRVSRLCPRRPGDARPSVFFTELLPRIEDANELRLTLYVIYALARRKGYPRFVTLRELRAEGPLVASMEDRGEDAAAGLGEALAAAVERGSLLRLEVERGGREETLVFLNSPADRRAVALIEQGQLPLGRPLPPESRRRRHSDTTSSTCTRRTSAP